jgi:hypothetical protein
MVAKVGFVTAKFTFGGGTYSIAQSILLGFYVFCFGLS